MTTPSRSYRRAVFVDSSAFYLLIDDNDVGHRRASELVGSIRSERRDLVTSNLIVAETHALVLRRLGRSVALTFLHGVRSGIAEVVRIDVADEERAVEIIEGYQDKAFSYTDATSFALMSRLKISAAFTFDRHFTQIGFTALGLED